MTPSFGSVQVRDSVPSESTRIDCPSSATARTSVSVTSRRTAVFGAVAQFVHPRRKVIMKLKDIAPKNRARKETSVAVEESLWLATFARVDRILFNTYPPNEMRNTTTGIRQVGCYCHFASSRYVALVRRAKPGQSCDLKGGRHVNCPFRM